MNRMFDKCFLQNRLDLIVLLVAVLIGAQCLVYQAQPSWAEELTQQAIEAPDFPGDKSCEDTGTLEATGKHFELTNSDYLNVRLDSSEHIKLSLKSIPSMVTMHIESTSGATSTLITLGGFLPSKTYYMYQDDFHNYTAMTTDENGCYAYTQDISQGHLIMIQLLPSTIYLNEDGWSVPGIGDWDPINRIATLTQDVTQTIQIDVDNITLDGNGHTTALPGGPEKRQGYGVYLPPTRTGVTVKNIKIRNFYTGIGVYKTNNCTVESNTVTDCSNGIGIWDASNNKITGNHIDLYERTNYYVGTGMSIANYGTQASGNVISNNTVLNSKYGFETYGCNGNTLSGNKFSGSRFYNFAVLPGDFGEYLNNNIDTTNLVDGKPIYYIRNASDMVIDGSTDAGLVYLINCNNITVKDVTCSKGLMGVMLWRSNNCLIENVNASGNGQPWDGYGIYLNQSAGNTIKNCTANWNNYYGIYLKSSTSNTITGNTTNLNIAGSGIKLHGSPGHWNTAGNAVSNNSIWHNGCGVIISNSYNSTFSGNKITDNREGIYIHWSGSNTFKNNLISNNRTGLYSIYMAGNAIYNNNFIENTKQVQSSAYGSPDIYNLDIPVGGNYWSDHISQDANNDGFADTPYVNGSVQDGLPWMKPDGWVDSIAPTTIASLFGNPGKSGWYTSSVQVTLMATDDLGGSGVKRTEYSINGASWTKYAEAFNIDNEGTTTVSYRSVDSMDNLEAAKTEVVKIDRVMPAISISGLIDGGLYAAGDITVTFSVEDTTSGVATVSGVIEDLDGNKIPIISGITKMIGAGIYKLTVTAGDVAGNVLTKEISFVVYDPSAGFVTGHGQIDSPTGAYAPDPMLTGRAMFGFVSRYDKGAALPSGATQFRFHSAGLNFVSTSYEWLVVAGARAQLKGEGTINGVRECGFMLTAIDGQVNGGGDVDKFRIKIWDKATGTIIYDNQAGADGTTEPATAIAVGSIMIQTTPVKK